MAYVLFTHELARRLDGTSATANALHPGVVSTSFGAEDPARLQHLLLLVMRPFMKSVDRGAATSIHVASSPELRTVSGQYFFKSKPKEPSKRSHDMTAAGRL